MSMGRASLQLLAVCFIFKFMSFIYANDEADALMALKNSFNNPDELNSWSDPESSESPCNWFHITCDSNNSVTRIDLGNAGFSADSLPQQLGNLKNLQYLELYSNHISGNMSVVPWLSLTNLVSLDLYSNNLSGIIPGSVLSQLSNLIFIRLNDNSLEGPLPPEFSDLQNLQKLDLSNNNIVGNIPEQWGNISPSLNTLKLKNNKLTGTVPQALADKFNQMIEVDLTNNDDLTGLCTDAPCHSNS